MRWEGNRESENVEDRRGGPSPGVMVGGGIGTLVIVVLGLLFGVSPAKLMQVVQQGQGQQAPGGGGGEAAPETPESKKMKSFVSTVLADTEDVWTEIFSQNVKTYKKPKLVLFSGSTSAGGCGLAKSAIGPFYCPADEKVYLDTSFFDELSNRFGAPGDFARSYVIAHEIGHHVQRLLGRTAQVDAMRGKISEAEYNKLSVRLELQADFYAGVWAHHADKERGILERGDVEGALAAAKAIGDDALQKAAQGYVVPDSFTHGTSEQRARWFRLGLQTGDVSKGDTFKAREL